jgi:hypothetical protein
MTKKRFLYFAILALSIFPIGELAARLLGYKPYGNHDFKIESNPDRCITGDSMLGFRLVPGEFIVTLNRKLNYHVRHTADGRRWTGDETKKSNSIGFFGCSFTYGMGVDDSLTFVYRISQALDSLSIKNYAVPGYGTTQSYLQLRDLEREKRVPNTIVLCFSKVHFERNVLKPSYRNALRVGYAHAEKNAQSHLTSARFPYVKGSTIRWDKWKDLYSNMPGRSTFAVMNYMNGLRDKKQARSMDAVSATKVLIKRIQTIANRQNSKLLIVFLDESPDIDALESFTVKSRISTLHCNWSMDNVKETNSPYDDHPNSLAHERIASLILKKL